MSCHFPRLRPVQFWGEIIAWLQGHRNKPLVISGNRYAYFTTCGGHWQLICLLLSCHLSSAPIFVHWGRYTHPTNAVILNGFSPSIIWYPDRDYSVNYPLLLRGDCRLHSGPRIDPAAAGSHYACGLGNSAARRHGWQHNGAAFQYAAGRPDAHKYFGANAGTVRVADDSADGYARTDEHR